VLAPGGGGGDETLGKSVGGSGRNPLSVGLSVSGSGLTKTTVLERGVIAIIKNNNISNPNNSSIISPHKLY